MALPPNSGRTFSALFGPQLFSGLVVGATTLIVANTLIYGFVTWRPTFFVQQGLSIASSFKYSFLMTMGAPVGAAIGALTADSLGRKPAIIGASFMAILFGGIYPFIRDPALLPLVGFFLVVSIYILVALLFAIYIPELFPADVRMRAIGLCNTLGRTATIGLLVVQILVVHFMASNPGCAASRKFNNWRPSPGSRRQYLSFRFMPEWQRQHSEQKRQRSQRHGNSDRVEMGDACAHQKRKSGTKEPSHRSGERKRAPPAFRWILFRQP